MGETQRSQKIWLIGDTISFLSETKLPTTLDVLKCFFNHHTIGRKTIKDSAKLVAKEVENIWEKTAIPTLHRTNIKLKIEALKSRHEHLQKGKNRITQIQFEKEESFRQDLSQLFDVSSGKSQLSITTEQQQFLDDQGGERQLKIEAIKDKIQRKLKPTSVSQRIIQKKKSVKQNICEEVSSQDEESDEDVDDDFTESLNAYQRSKINPRPEMLKQVLKSSLVLSTLDRCNVSDGCFTMIASVMAIACGEDLSRSTISPSTVKRKREQNREIEADKVKKKFETSMENIPGVTIHFDGKKLKDLHATESKDRISKTERIGVVVTGNNIQKMLGVKKEDNGTGATIAKTVFDSCTEWNVVDRITGVCFDTTGSNTGRLKGACKLLEKDYIKRNLLQFACRHHVYEIVIGGVFKELFAPSTGPKIELFERFKLEWKNIDQTKFEGLPNKHFKKKFAAVNRKNTIDFLLRALSSSTTYKPRDDYREIMELCLLILGHPLPNYNFKLPGACHRARWMAKIIYVFKIYLFRKQFALSKNEIESLEQICLFAALTYVKPWIECPLASDAPVNDLLFFKQLLNYSSLNKQISEIAIAKFKNHLWYLGAELVVLSLFSKKVSPNEKRKMIQKLKQLKSDWRTRANRLTNIVKLEDKTLIDLIGVQSLPALSNLNVKTDFIFKLDPEKWEESIEYKEAKSVIDNVKVVNDVAERSLALMTDFNGSFTKIEKKKQLALQVVEENRKQIKGCTKKILSSFQHKCK